MVLVFIDYWFLENGGTHFSIGLDRGGTLTDWRGNTGYGPDLSKLRIGILTITNYNWNYEDSRIVEGSRFIFLMFTDLFYVCTLAT